MLKLADKLLDWLPGPGLVYITAAMSGLTYAADDIAAAAPEGSEPVLAGLVLAVSWLGGLAQAIRRVSEVPAILRGLRLPDGSGMALTARSGSTITTVTKGEPVSETGTDTSSPGSGTVVKGDWTVP